MPKKTTLGHVNHAVNVCLSTVGITVSKLPERGTLERVLRDMLKKFNVNCVIDVGAHHGEFGSMLRKVGYGGRIVSFEPSEEAFQLVTKLSQADDLWEVHRMCLGAEDGEVEIRKFESTDFNSLYEPTKSALNGRWSESLQASGTERVPMRKLDAMLQTLGVDSTDLCLKIDTQGHDLQVVAGAKETLKQTRMLLTELSVVGLYEGAPRLEEAIAALREEAYLPVGFFPVVHDRDGVTVFEFDCIFVNSNRPLAVS